jgi:hypothetical protein
MNRRLLPLALPMAIGLMWLALWVWNQGTLLAIESGKPLLVLWSARCAAIAAGCVAQAVLLGVVVGSLYPPRSGRTVLAVSALALGGVALLGAAVLGLAGQA